MTDFQIPELRVSIDGETADGESFDKEWTLETVSIGEGDDSGRAVLHDSEGTARVLLSGSEFGRLRGAHNMTEGGEGE